MMIGSRSNAGATIHLLKGRKMMHARNKAARLQRWDDDHLQAQANGKTGILILIPIALTGESI
jgi:hypothetical protein